MRSLSRLGRTSNFAINEYPPAAAVLYWFVDGITRAKIDLATEAWGGPCDWAAKEFNRTRSLVVAKHDAMLGPIAMAMSGCLCARLRATQDESHPMSTKAHIEGLPSTAELERSIEETPMLWCLHDASI